MSAIEEKRYDAWGEFKDRVLEDLYHGGVYVREQFVFRGHANAEWRLTPSLDRWIDEIGLSGVDRVVLEEQLLGKFREELQGLRTPLREPGDPQQLAIMAQHCGLPTRLLDWTESLYVGVFFAFSGVVIGAPDAEDVAIWALDTRSPIWNAELGVSLLPRQMHVHERVREQSGRFTLSRTPFSHLEQFVESNEDPQIALIRLLLPADCAVEVLADLDCMGINYAALFPDLVGCSMSAKMKSVLDSRR